jgi:cytochrome P450
MEAKLLLATLAQRWIALVDPSHAVELRPRVTLRPKGGLPVTLIAR